MRTLLKVSVLAVLLVIVPACCFAEMSIMTVSREKALALGLKVRSKPNGPNEVWVELELKAEGQLKDFSHVSLEIREGEKFLLGYTALKEKTTSSGSVVVNFMANRAFLEKLTLNVVAGQPMDMRGYQLRVKDFVEPEEVK